LDVVLSEEAEARLVPIVGGISLALALTFKTLDPAVKNPATEHWDRAKRIFDLLLDAAAGNCASSRCAESACSAGTRTP
jgi:hypothetical protein